MKIGVSSYSFSRLVADGQIRQLDVIAMAKDLGFDVIEFSTFTLPKGETNLSFARQVREEADRVGIEVGNYTIAADFLNFEGGVAAQVEVLKAEVDVAAAMGSPGMRHDATWGIPAGKPYRSFESVLDTLAVGCRAVTEYAREKGIRTMVENHGYYAQDSMRVEALINAVGHPNFGWLVDMGNFLCADEPPELAVARAAGYAFHLHIKDFHVKPGTMPDPGEGWFLSRAGNWLRGAIVGHGNVPVLQCLRIMKNAGYQGTVSLEFEGMEDPVTAIRIGRDNIVRYLDMLK